MTLTDNMDKIHTTAAGEERIRRNLNLPSDDVVLWCKAAILNADIMMCFGKNWYVYGSGNVITVNAKSLTVITAHKIKAKIRQMETADYPCLPEFLFQSVFIPKGAVAPEREIVYKNEIFTYIKDFGTKNGDLGVVALVNGQVSGAAWTRIFGKNGSPELVVSLFPELRG